ncbi:MAG: 50S ribosomal protein L10 [Clostridiales bacterium]
MPSAKVLEKKKQEVLELSKEFKEAKSLILADYRGLTVEEDTEMRKALRKEGIKYKVIKNRLTIFAVKECGLDGLEEHLKGPTAVAISITDLVAPAKVLSEYAKKYDNLELKVGVVEGEVIDKNKIKSLAELPSKEELITRVVRGFNAPITGLVTVLNGNLKNLAVVLSAIAEKKDKAE